ncbi:MAG: hypothetical protein Q9228_004499 [Teloschistes exilis]
MRDRTAERSKKIAFQRSIFTGKWQEFLLEDADITRAAFAKWYSEAYLKSPQGQSTPASVKREILRACDSSQCLDIERDVQLPQTIAIFEAWEAIPMDPESREMTQARVRLIRDVLLTGNIQNFHAHGLYATPYELERARRWIHLESDGSLSKYSSLRLPIKYKDLVYDNTTSQWYTITAGSDGNLEQYEAAASEGLLHHPERVRVSARTLKHLINGTYPSQQGQSTSHQPDPSQGAAGPPAKWAFEIFSVDDDDDDQPAAGGVRLSSGQEGAGNSEIGLGRGTPDSDLTTEIGEEYYRGLDEFEGTPDRYEDEGERREEVRAGFTIPPHTATTSQDEEAGAASSFSPSSTQDVGTRSGEDASTVRTRAANHPATKETGEEMEMPDWVRGILSHRADDKGPEQRGRSSQKRKRDDDDHDTDRAPADRRARS